MKDDGSQHFSGKVAQKVILEHDDKFLVCRGVGETLWEFPGGRLNNGEDPMESVAREVQEELDIVIKDYKPFHVGRSLHVSSNTWRVLIAYHAVLASPTFTLDQDELDDAMWVTRDELAALSLFDDCRVAANFFLGLI